MNRAEVEVMNGLAKSVVVVVCSLLAGCSGGDGGAGGKPPGGADGSGTETGTDTGGPTDPTDPGPDEDQDGFGASVDCDDADPAVFPGAPDACDGVVYDCDRTSDEGLVTVDGAATFDDLGAALDAAGDGSELLVCPGTYNGAFVASVPVRLVALEDATTTILSGSGAGDSTLQVPGGTELVGLTIRDGAGTEGGGVRMTSAGTLLLDGCVVDDNGANIGGGLYVSEGSTATLVNTTVEGNRAVGGGGIAVASGATLDLSDGGLVAGNEALGWGGGLWVDGGHVVGGVVSGNVMEAYSYPYYYEQGLPDLTGEAFSGGGVATTGQADLTGTEVTGNLSTYAGGLSVTGGTTTLVDVSIGTNVAYQIGGGLVVWGGALVLEGTSEVWGNYGGEAGGGEVIVFGSVSGGHVHGNLGQEYAGGVFAISSTVEGQEIEANEVDGPGGGLFAMGPVTVTGSTLAGNLADQGGGAATHLDFGRYFDEYTPTELRLVDCVVSGNDARQGGGLFSGWALTTSGTEVTDNTADRGAGVYVQGGEVALTGGAVLRNAAAVAGGGAEVKAGALSLAGVDLGEGVDDNTPSDVLAGGVDHPYGADASTVCTATGCVP